jgi:hypothetical protein
MNVSIVHTSVRVSPELIVEIAAEADGKPILVELDRSAIDHLLGSALGDKEQTMAALGRHLVTIRRSLEAHVFARGAPLDGYLTLSWKELEPFAGSATSAA